jgi:hypothetical protein
MNSAKFAMGPFVLLSVWKVYIGAVVASLLLSSWCAHVLTIPNPDAVYYLRSAELIAIGQVQEALSIFRWPLYSFVIAGPIWLFEMSVETSAQIVNAFFDCITVVTFMALVRSLAPASVRHQLFLWATVVILMHPRLMGLRGVVVRDHGFVAFFVLALYLIAIDYRTPKRANKICIALAILAAALFRVEALYLLIVVSTFYLYASARGVGCQIASVAGMLLFCLLLVPGYLFWINATNVPKVLSGTGSALDMLVPLRDFTGKVSAKAAQLGAILPPFRNIGGLAYTGVTVAILVDVVLRALTIPLGILAVLAFVPKRVMPPFSEKLVVWFAGWQLPLLIVYAVAVLYLDWRYAIALVLIASIPVVFTISELHSRGVAGGWKERVILLAAFLALLGPWLWSFPRHSELEHIRKAGVWIKENLTDASIYTNDLRIFYYAGRLEDSASFTDAGPEQELMRRGYAAIDVQGENLPVYLRSNHGFEVIQTIPGVRERKVLILKLR